MTFASFVFWAAKIMEICASGAVAWGAIRWTPALLNRLRLVRERDAARSETEDVRQTMSTLKDGIEGWSLTVGTLAEEVRDLRDQVLEFRKVQLISTKYIAALIYHISEGGTAQGMPPIPVELRDEVLEHLRDAQVQRRSTSSTI